MRVRNLLTTLLILTLLTTSTHAHIDLESPEPQSPRLSFRTVSVSERDPESRDYGMVQPSPYKENKVRTKVLSYVLDSRSALASSLAWNDSRMATVGAHSEVGQTAWHVGSGVLVGGATGGIEGAIGAASANLLADLAFKTLAS